MSLLRVLTAAAAMLAMTPAGATDTHCFDHVAATRGYTLGAPADATPSPDGKSVLYLRSGPRDTVQRLFAYDLATSRERELIAPEALLGGQPEHLSAEEKARRERARVSVKGFTTFSLSRDGSKVLLVLGGRLFVLMRGNGAVVPLPGEGWIAPQLSPDGTRVGALHDDDLHVLDIARKTDTQLTHGAGETSQHGEAEFVAQEEMVRPHLLRPGRRRRHQE